MSILSGFFKTKKYRKTTDGYKLESNWTSGNTVELDDGNTVQNNLGAIKGITTSTSVTETGYAADATTVAALNESSANKSFVPIYATTNEHGRRIYDTLEINLITADASENKVGYVYSGFSKSLPTDCNTGIREVYYYNSQNIIAKITGVSTNGYCREWFNLYNGTTWTGWTATKMEVV